MKILEIAGSIWILVLFCCSFGSHSSLYLCHGGFLGNTVLMYLMIVLLRNCFSFSIFIEIIITIGDADRIS